MSYIKLYTYSVSTVMQLWLVVFVVSFQDNFSSHRVT